MSPLELKPDPLQIPPNAATRARERWQDAIETGDWTALDALCAPTLTVYDRRDPAHMPGDRKEFIASARLIGSSGTQVWRTLLAAPGDLLALEHTRWTGISDDQAFDSETLALTEIDAGGRIVTVIDFDANDRRAASIELLERYARGEAELRFPPAAFEMIRAMNDRDVARLRASIATEFFFHDHQRAGVWPRRVDPERRRLETADQYIAWIAALFEHAPELTFAPLYHVAHATHGNLSMDCMFGRFAGGEPVESVHARLVLYRDDRVIGMELFDREDLDIARARFNELCASLA
jgi:hypothetical protein